MVKNCCELLLKITIQIESLLVVSIKALYSIQFNLKLISNIRYLPHRTSKLEYT